MTTPKRTFLLPDLPFRDSEVGRLVRCLLVDGDMTVILPLQECLLEEGRWAEAGLLKGEVAATVIRSGSVGDWDRPEDRWRRFATEVLGVFLFDVFEPSAVIHRADQLMTGSPSTTIQASLSEAARRIMRDTEREPPPETLTVVTGVSLTGVDGGRVELTADTQRLELADGVLVGVSPVETVLDTVYLYQSEE